VVDHSYTSVFTGAGYVAPAWPLLLLGVYMIFRSILGVWLVKMAAKVIPSIKIGDIELDEEIGNYFKALSDDDRLW